MQWSALSFVRVRVITKAVSANVFPATKDESANCVNMSAKWRTVITMVIVSTANAIVSQATRENFVILVSFMRMKLRDSQGFG